MITTTSSLPQDNPWETKGVQISHDNCSAFTNWMITDKEFATPERPQMLAQPPYSFDLSVMYWAPTLALGGTLFALPSAITQDFKQLFATIFSSDCYLDFNTIFCRYGHVVWRFQCWKMPGDHPFLLWWGKVDSQDCSEIARAFPKCTHHQCLRPNRSNCSSFGCSRNRWDVSYFETSANWLPKRILPTFIIDEAGDKLPNGEQGDHRIWPSRFKRLKE